MLLDEVEDALTQPEHERVDNPNDAQQGDVLAGNLQVVKRLGQGASSVGFLVKQDDKDYILKVANDSEQNDRIRMKRRCWPSYDIPTLWI
jgi:hypothetical protein